MSPEQRKSIFTTQIVVVSFPWWSKILRIKTLFLICLLFSLNLFGQTPGNVKIEEVYLAKDDGNGLAGESATIFYTTDIPIHCVVKLDSFKPVTVKMNFIAVKVFGVKTESKVLSIKYKTNGEQSQVNFTGKPDKNWVAGNYRIEILVDEIAAETLDFEIIKNPLKVEKSKTPVQKIKTNSIRKFKKG